MSAQHWSTAIRAANKQCDPPEIHLLLRDARAAQRRDRARRSILDVATAVELIIDTALRTRLGRSQSAAALDTLLTKEWKFSRRVTLMERSKMWLPPGLQDKVMGLRNKVIHENASVTKTQAAAAIEIVEQLADRYAPLS
jgi:hypothetical protein